MNNILLINLFFSGYWIYSRQKNMILKMYKDMTLKSSDMSLRQMVHDISLTLRSLCLQEQHLYYV